MVRDTGSPTVKLPNNHPWGLYSLWPLLHWHGCCLTVCCPLVWLLPRCLLATNIIVAVLFGCSDGLSRTGAFCALYSVLERVKTEQIVDVFQAIKTLRIQRTGLLGTIVSYSGGWGEGGGWQRSDYESIWSNKYYHKR